MREVHRCEPMPRRPDNRSQYQRYYSSYSTLHGKSPLRTLSRRALNQALSFSHYIPRILVAPNSGESRMTQSILWRPFQKLDSSDDEWI
jgi:hypothetical protein